MNEGAQLDHEDDQLLLVVDARDRFLGRYVRRDTAHTGEGERHRAFVCMVLDDRGQTLLQKRRHWLWDDLWDLAAVSHVLHVDGHDESYAEAAARALDREMGIQGAMPVKLTGFNYYAKHPVGEGCENEYCTVLVARYDGLLTPNPECLYEYRWAGLESLLAELLEQPKIYTPWARLAVETLVGGGLWPPRA